MHGAGTRVVHDRQRGGQQDHACQQHPNYCLEKQKQEFADIHPKVRGKTPQNKINDSKGDLPKKEKVIDHCAEAHS